MELFRNIFHGSHVYSQSLMDSSQSYIKHSATQCAATCRTSPQYNQSWSCNSFLYSETTGLCRIAHSVALLEDLFYQGYGDLYAGCDIGRGYRLYTWGNITACLLLVTSAQVLGKLIVIWKIMLSAQNLGELLVDSNRDKSSKMCNEMCFTFYELSK